MAIVHASSVSCVLAWYCLLQKKFLVKSSKFKVCYMWIFLCKYQENISMICWKENEHWNIWIDYEISIIRMKVWIKKRALTEKGRDHNKFWWKPPQKGNKSSLFIAFLFLVLMKLLCKNNLLSTCLY